MSRSSVRWQTRGGQRSSGSSVLLNSPGCRRIPAASVTPGPKGCALSRIAGSDPVREVKPILNCSSIASSIVPSGKSSPSLRGRGTACPRGAVAWSRDPNIPVRLSLRRRGGKKRVPHSVVQHGHPASAAALTLKTEKLVDFLQTFWPSPGPVAFMGLIKDPGGHDLDSHLSKTLRVNL